MAQIIKPECQNCKFWGGNDSVTQAECGLPGQNDGWEISNPPLMYFQDGCGSFAPRPELVAPAPQIMAMPPFNNVYTERMQGLTPEKIWDNIKKVMADPVLRQQWIKDMQGDWGMHTWIGVDPASPRGDYSVIQHHWRTRRPSVRDGFVIQSQPYFASIVVDDSGDTSHD
jgi:hypothetical protein